MTLITITAASKNVFPMLQDYCDFYACVREVCQFTEYWMLRCSIAWHRQDAKKNRTSFLKPQGSWQSEWSPRDEFVQNKTIGINESWRIHGIFIKNGYPGSIGDCNTLPDPVNPETQLGNKAVELVSVRLKILYRSFLAVAWSRKDQTQKVRKCFKVYPDILQCFNSFRPRQEAELKPWCTVKSLQVSFSLF